MMGYYGAWAWLWMSGMMLIAWGVVTLFAVWAIRAVRGSGGPGDAALDTLRRRLAAGEISQDEYDRTRRVLHG